MSVSILEALQNAQVNFKDNFPFQRKLAENQLRNAIILLEKKYDVDEQIEPLLEKYGNVENVPEK